jgi:GNAT superfamily N-acetyltransferase
VNVKSPAELRRQQLAQASDLPEQHEAIRSRVQRLLKTHRSALPRLLLRKLLARFVRTETLILYHLRLKQASPAPAALAPDFPVIRIERPDSETFRNLCAQYPQGNFHRRLHDEGRQCFVTLHEGRIAGYAWVADSRIYIDEIACSYPIAADEIFIYDCFVDNEFRGKGIYPRMLAAVLQDHSYGNSKPEKALIAASSVNQASIRGILKTGFVELKRIRYAECCGKQRWWGLTP